VSASGISEETRRFLREKTDRFLEACSGVCEASYRHGSKSALLFTMYAHLNHGRPIPKWAQAAFIRAYLSCPKSWDEVFGCPVEKGKSAGAKWRKQKNTLPVVLAIRSLHAKGKAINEDLFSEAANGLSLSAADVRRLYYSDEGKMCQQLSAIAERLNLDTSEATNFDAIFHSFIAEDPPAVKRIKQLIAEKKTSHESGKD
jgi:hypothetical protein